MRWFKHLSSASDDPFLVNLEARFGLEGYARWWKLLEAVASQVNPKEGRWTVSYPWTKWQQILQGKRKKLETFLEHLANQRRISAVPSGNILEIGICNMQKYIDEYSRKSGHTPDKLRTKDTDTEAETEKEKDTLILKSSQPDKGTAISKAPPQSPPSPDGSGLCVGEDQPPVGSPEKPKRTKKAAKAPAEYSASFLAFWEAYPRKVGKVAAFEAWQAIGKRGDVKATRIIEAIKAQVASGHLGVDIQHIPHPSTWLNNSRWEDEVAQAGTLPAARGHPPAQPRTFYQRKQAENEQKAQLVLKILEAENGQTATPASPADPGGHALPVGQVGT